MTLVAAFVRNGFPFMIGDALLSSLEPRTDRFILPTVGKSTKLRVEVRENEYKISGLAQKVNVIHERLVVGFTGGREQAEAFLMELKFRASADQPALESVIDTLKHCDSGIWSNLGIAAGFLTGGEQGGVISHGKGIDTTPLESLVGLRVLGSGRAGFYDVATYVLRGEMPSCDEFGRHAAFIRELMVPLSMVGNLISREIRSQSTLLDSFGGGFEIIAKFGAGFEKVDRVLYIEVLTTVKGGEVDFRIVPRFQYFSYVGNLLLIQSIYENEDGSFGRRTTPVPPIDEPLLPEAKITTPPISPMFTVIMVHLLIFARLTNLSHR